MATLMTVGLVTSQVDVGNREELFLDFTGDASYPAGGYDLLASDLPLRVGTLIETIEGSDPTTGRKLQWDKASGKLLWLDADGVQVVAAVDLSAVTIRARAFGR